jgi:hypothetical protein
MMVRLAIRLAFLAEGDAIASARRKGECAEPQSKGGNSQKGKSLVSHPQFHEHVHSAIQWQPALTRCTRG